MSILEPWFSGTPRVVRKMTQVPMPHFIDRSCLIQCKAESLSSLHSFSWRCQADDIDDAVTFGLLSSSDVWRVQCVHVCYTVLTAVTTDDSRSTSCSDCTTLVCHKTHTLFMLTLGWRETSDAKLLSIKLDFLLNELVFFWTVLRLSWLMSDE